MVKAEVLIDGVVTTKRVLHEKVEAVFGFVLKGKYDILSTNINSEDLGIIDEDLTKKIIETELKNDGFRIGILKHERGDSNFDIVYGITDQAKALAILQTDKSVKAKYRTLEYLPMYIKRKAIDIFVSVLKENGIEPEVKTFYI